MVQKVAKVVPKIPRNGLKAVPNGPFSVLLFMAVIRLVKTQLYIFFGLQPPPNTPVPEHGA